MDWKWIDQTFFESEPSGGGGAAPSNALETDSGPPEPSGESAAPAPAPAAEAEPGPVAFPDRLKSVFIPRSSDDRPSRPTVTALPGEEDGGRPAPQRPQPPTPEMWQMEPDKAAQMQQAYLEHKIEQGIRKATEPYREIRQNMDRERQTAFQTAAYKAQGAIEKHWEQVLNRDREFRANQKLQEMTERTMGEFIAAALNHGSIEDLEFVTTTKFAKRALAIAKADLDETEAFTVRATGGPQPVGRQGMKQPSGPVLDEEIERGLPEASKWSGREYTPEMIAKARKKIDDSEW